MLLNLSLVQLARFTLGLAWIYHGLIPKLLHVDPLERIITESLGLNSQYSLVFTQSAGVAEILLGIALILFYKNPLLIYFSALNLAALLVFTIIFIPQVALSAFNPVTTNIPLLVLSVVLLQNTQQKPTITQSKQERE
ncbi:DoxX-like family protein [Aliiglaciecola sp. 3_MG-2023]|uniref:DoxX-like family protein n=1 Tax=Aliiglaciecola sp. 3_MG-2023 TaxID=3062644 RepID=UPI0026E1465A|nr:DoxX-like family protein [Aliiglaciecola sp. 3_MG-2023]MDO6694300.1 DoxX-like family protein [Aliiglaciecola sp. 3_MG-2023]